jgi:hypothetical protein
VHKALFQPSLAVLEGLARVAINPAQEGAAHAALHAVVGTGCIGRNELGGRLGHAASVIGPFRQGSLPLAFWNRVSNDDAE